MPVLISLTIAARDRAEASNPITRTAATMVRVVPIVMPIASLRERCIVLNSSNNLRFLHERWVDADAEPRAARAADDAGARLQRRRLAVHRQIRVPLELHVRPDIG